MSEETDAVRGGGPLAGPSGRPAHRRISAGIGPGPMTGMLLADLGAESGQYRPPGSRRYRESRAPPNTTSPRRNRRNLASI